MRRACLVLFVAVALAGCGPKPIERIDVEPLLFESGDVPSGWLPGQIRDTAQGDTAGAELIVARDLDHPLNPAISSDEIALLIYPDVEKAQAGYDRLLPGITVDGRPYDVGEQGRERGNIVQFRRCRAVVVIRMTLDDLEVDQIGSYARRVDERLQPVVC